MDKTTIRDRLRHMLEGIGWRMFIRFSPYTEEEYWAEVYRQEKANRGD